MRPVKVLAITALLATAACGASESNTVQGESLTAREWLTATAEVENGLPYDGCQWAIHIDGQMYGPDASGTQRLSALSFVAGRTAVDITYRTTGAATTIECGWGQTKRVDEISISSVTPR